MKRLLGLAGLGALIAAFGIFAAVALAGDKPKDPAEPPGNHVPVTICHATNSETNPYVIESPDNDSIIKAGHGDHTGPIFEPGMKADKVRWGDVIPAFSWWELEKVDGNKVWVQMNYPGMNGGDISKCITEQPPGDIEVTATAPTFQDPTCELGAAVKLPTVTGVTYTIVGTVAPGETVKVEATADEGYKLVGTHTWKHTFGNVPENCTTLIEVTATAPAFQDPTCEVSAAVTLPTVTGVTYAIEGTVAAGEKVTVKATAKNGYVLKGTDEWKHTFGKAPDNCTPPSGPAIEVTPGVTFQDPTCDAGAAVIPTTTTGLTYTIDGKVAPGEKVTVSASANDGYTIIGNNSWEHTFGQVPSNCTRPTPPTAPTTPTTPTTPTAPLTPPTTKPVAKKPAVKKPAAKPAPAAPKKAVAGAFAKEPPKLAYTP